MKIEKVNDHQIRCTLTKKELEKRDLKLSEIAYGNEKVKRLFQDMMQMAAYECDFEAEDTPLMIEIIPFSECAVIVVTKVEDPDELDTRFSRFAPSVHEEGGDTLSGLISDVFHSITENSDEISELFKKMKAHNDDEATKLTEKEENTTAELSDRNIFFRFSSLNEAISACRSLNAFYRGESILYKDASKGQFVLYLHAPLISEEEFGRICSLLSEFAKNTYDNGYYKFYVKEHCEQLISENAVNALGGI